MDNEKPFQKTSAMKKNNSDLTLKNFISPNKKSL